jgi:hypothetical protein
MVLCKNKYDDAGSLFLSKRRVNLFVAGNKGYAPPLLLSQRVPQCALELRVLKLVTSLLQYCRFDVLAG